MCSCTRSRSSSEARSFCDLAVASANRVNSPLWDPGPHHHQHQDRSQDQKREADNRQQNPWTARRVGPSQRTLIRGGDETRERSFVGSPQERVRQSHHEAIDRDEDQHAAKQMVRRPVERSRRFADSRVGCMQPQIHCIVEEAQDFDLTRIWSYAEQHEVPALATASRHMQRE